MKCPLLVSVVGATMMLHKNIDKCKTPGDESQPGLADVTERKAT
jgi:hypothetical protein